MQTSCWKGIARHSLVSSDQVRRTRITCQTRSYFSPLQWLRGKVNPENREKQTKEEIAEARKQVTEAQSIFEAQPAALERSVKERKEGKDRVLLNKRTCDKFVRVKEHKYSTANFKISHRKLNMLGKQISGKPIDWAILQMQFSEKRASTRIMNMLATAKDHASRYKKMDLSKVVVSEAWVSKGERPPKTFEPRGRGHFGVRQHPMSKMTVILRHGKTVEEKKAERREKILKRIVSAGVTREDIPLRNPSPMWSW